MASMIGGGAGRRARHLQGPAPERSGADARPSPAWQAIEALGFGSWKEELEAVLSQVTSPTARCPCAMSLGDAGP